MEDVPLPDPVRRGLPEFNNAPLKKRRSWRPRSPQAEDNGEVLYLMNRIKALAQSGLTIIEVMSICIMRGVQPLQYRGHPLWCYNGADDATRCGRKGPDNAVALVKILSELFKGEEEEFTRIKPRDGFSMYNPPSWVSYISLLPPASFVVSIHLASLRQELRKAIKEVSSPSPQPEDPGRALDSGLEEDPVIFVDLIDRQFYQLSCDDAMVAIIADYPGLLPASHVRKTGVPTSEKDPLFRTSRTTTYGVLQGRPSGRHAEPAATRQQRAPKPGRVKRKAVRTETPAQRYDKEPRSVVVIFKI